MESLPDLTHTGWPFPFTPEDWEHTPSASASLSAHHARCSWGNSRPASKP